MKKFTKKAIVFLLATLMTIPTFVGCKPQVLEKDDETKTQLHVFSFTGGIGEKWIYAVKERFESDYEDVCFEPGTNKKGVQIHVDAAKKNEHLTMNTSKNHVLFAENADYALMVNNGEIIEISDIMDKPLNTIVKTDDTRSIADKLFPETADFYSFKNDAYYGLPHHSFFGNLTYNKKLFDDKKLYFAATPSGDELIDQFIGVGNMTKSCGPDGVMGNDDDGLPATYDEMFLLFDYMTKGGKSVTPIIWPGKNAVEHTNYLLNAVYLNLAGKDEARLNYTYDSGEDTITIVEKFDGDTPVYKEEKVTLENYDKVLKSSQARYQAIEVLDKILDNPSYRHRTCKDTNAQMLQAQRDFILSNLEGDPVAILTEGSYWFNEANDALYFDDAKNNYPDDYDDKNDFRLMPLPRVYSGRAKDVLNTNVGKIVIGDMPDSLACINATIKNNENLVNLAKTFLAYCYTDESLREFTEKSNIVVPVDYEVEESELSTFAQDVVKFFKNSDFVVPYSSSSIYLSGKLNWSLNVSSNFWKKAYNGVVGTEKTKSAQAFFKSYAGIS